MREKRREGEERIREDPFFLPLVQVVSDARAPSLSPVSLSVFSPHPQLYGPSPRDAVLDSINQHNV